MNEKANWSWIGTGLSFLGLFVFGQYFSKTGFDVTDTGFNLGNQWALIQGWEEYNWGLIWLADLIGGLWLLLAEPLGLYGAHLGWCVLLGINGVVLYQLLSRYFAPVSSLLYTIATGIIMSPGRLKILYYTNLSAAFLMAAAYTLWTIFLFPKKCSPGFYRFFLYGVLIAGAFHSRFPSVLALFYFPLVPLLAHFFIRHEFSSKILLRSTLCLVSSIVCSFLMFLPLLIYRSGKEYFFNLKFTFGLVEGAPGSEEHTSRALLDLYLKHVSWKMTDSLILSFSLLVLFMVLRFSKKKSLFFLTLGFLAVFQYWFFFTYLPLEENAFRAVIGTSILLLSIVVCIGLIISSFHKPEVRSSDLSMVMLFLGAALISIAGSNVGILNFAEASWLIFPSLLIILLISLGKIDPKSRGALWIMLLIFIPIAIKAFQIRENSPYRDYSQRETLAYEFSHKKLKSIHTTRGRVRSFSEFLDEADKLLQKGEYTLAYNSIPIIYFLTETKPYLKYSWPSIHGAGAVKYFLQDPNTDTLPRYIFKAITNTQSYHWGNGVFVAPHNKIYHEATQALDAWVVANEYRVAWKNEDFVILKRKDL